MSLNLPSPTCFWGQPQISHLFLMPISHLPPILTTNLPPPTYSYDKPPTSHQFLRQTSHQFLRQTSHLPPILTTNLPPPTNSYDKPPTSHQFLRQTSHLPLPATHPSLYYVGYLTTPAHILAPPPCIINLVLVAVRSFSSLHLLRLLFVNALTCISLLTECRALSRVPCGFES